MAALPISIQYFSTVRCLLKPGGFALIHAIGRMSPPSFTVPFVRKYIFPGGYVPSLSEVFASTERTGLWVDDCEDLTSPLLLDYSELAPALSGEAAKRR